jgi:hypothetical protein
MIKTKRIVALMIAAVLVITGPMVNAPVSYSQGGPRKPNILVIFGDDIGYWNVSALLRRVPTERDCWRGERKAEL